MPKVVIYPYYGPNRRHDTPVVEVRVELDSGEIDDLTIDRESTAQTMQALGLASPPVAASEANSRPAEIAMLIADTAQILQRGAGHDLAFVAGVDSGKDQLGIAVFGHIDGRVGQAAAELASQIVLSPGQAAPEQWQALRKLAQQHVRPAETRAILTAAQRRGIPVLDMDREPLQGPMRMPTQFRPNGHLWLGQGRYGRLLDGSFPLDRVNNRIAALLSNPGQRAALLRQLGAAPAKGPATGRLLLCGTCCWQWDNESSDPVAMPASQLDPRLLETLNKVRAATGAIALLAGLDPDGAIADTDLVPDLGTLPWSNEAGCRLDDAADALVAALFPEHAPHRIPVVAVTGSNGKTTTCRLAHHLFTAAGHTTGLVCTDAIYIGKRKVHDEDSGAFTGHAGVLTNRQVDAAVLENHHRGIAVRGFAFDPEVVSVVLNVSEEHLVPGEIETVEEMAEVKGALLRYANKAAVLFADDPLCRGMIPGINARLLCLVSLNQDIDALRTIAGDRSAAFCLLEAHEGETWMTFYEGDERTRVLPVGDAPFTFGGRAPTTTSNTLHATAAVRLAGVGWDAIRAGLKTFVPGPEMTPGRMNWYDHLPFGVLHDVAHNEDGFSKLCAFVDNLEADGHKVIAFAGVSKRPDEHNQRTAQQVAGHFDRYVCKDIQPSKPPKKRHVAPLMKNYLVDLGVDPADITVTTYGREVIFEILDSCRPGDLLVLVTGINESRHIPGWMAEYSAERGLA